MVLDYVLLIYWPLSANRKSPSALLIIIPQSIQPKNTKTYRKAANQTTLDQSGITGLALPLDG